MAEFLFKLQDVERHQTAHKLDSAVATSVTLPHSALPLAVSTDSDLPELDENSLNYVVDNACKATSVTPATICY